MHQGGGVAAGLYSRTSLCVQVREGPKFPFSLSLSARKFWSRMWRILGRGFLEVDRWATRGWMSS